MAKKDENGRIVIPEDLVADCVFLADYETSKKTKLVFFMNNQGEIGIAIILKLLPLPDDFKFLGNCNYDNENHSITIPENVDVALGDGEDYYFATSLEGRSYLYIYKNQNDMQKLYTMLANIQETLKAFEAYRDEENVDY